MKKIIFVFLGVLLFAYSCTKEEDKITENLNDDTGMREYLSNNNTEDQILDFIEQLDNPETGVSMLKEDMLWNMEAALNYKYSNINSLDYISTLEGNYNLSYTPDDEGLVDFNQINILYDSFKTILSEKYIEIQESDKRLLLVDFSLVEGDTIKMMYSFALGNAAYKESFVFDATDYWYYGASQGKCGLYLGQGVGSDAALLSDFMVRSYRWFLYVNSNPPYGTREVPNSVVSPMPIVAGQNSPSLIDPINPNDITPNDNLYDYLLASGSNAFPNWHYCISPTEMNFYYQGAWTLIYNQGSYYPLKELIYSNISEAHIGQAYSPNSFAHGLTTKWANLIHTTYGSQTL